MIMNANVGFLFINNDCNMRCKHCYISAQHRQTEGMSLNVLYKSLDLFKRFNISEIRITGGEATLHPKFTKIIEIINEQGFTVGLTTNGIRLFSNLAIRESVINSINRIWISQYGISSEGHDFIRNRTGMTLSRLMREFTNFSRDYLFSNAQGRIGLSCLITSDEFNMLLPYLREAIQLGIKRLRIIPVQIDGRATETLGVTHRINLEEYSNLIKSVSNNLSSNFDELRFNDPGDALLRYPNVRNSCLIRNRTMISINDKGGIFPCCILVNKKEHCLGSVLEMTEPAFPIELNESAVCHVLTETIWKQPFPKPPSCPINYV